MLRNRDHDPGVFHNQVTFRISQNQFEVLFDEVRIVGKAAVLPWTLPFLHQDDDEPTSTSSYLFSGYLHQVDIQDGFLSSAS